MYSFQTIPVLNISIRLQETARNLWSSSFSYNPILVWNQACFNTLTTLDTPKKQTENGFTQLNCLHVFQISVVFLFPVLIGSLQGFAGAAFVNQYRDREITPFGPTNDIGTGNSISWVLLLGPGSGMDYNQSHYWDQDGTILSPGTQQGPGNYP